MQAKKLQTGWESYRALCIPPNASATQVSESRKAFYGGAAILFGTLIGSVDGGDEPTQGDMDMMDGIAAELREFRDEMAAEAKRAKV